MAQFIKNNKRNPLERHSSQGLVLGCPICAAKLDLLDTRDGDQAYWCHRCQSGWRVGNLPEAAHRSKDSAIPEPQVEAVTPVAEARVTGKARATKTKVTAKVDAVSPKKQVINVTNVPQSQRQLASRPCVQGTTDPLTGLRRHRTQGEAKQHSLIAPRVKAKPLAAETVPPEHRAIPRAPASEPKATTVKTAAPSRTVSPKRVVSPRAADVAVSTPKTAASKNAPKQVQKKPALETSPRNSRRTAQTLAPISKPVKTKRQPLEVIATPVRAPRASVQKRKTLEIAAPAPQPKRIKRPPLEIAAPIKALTPRAKRSQSEQPVPVISGKGSRKSAAPVPKPASGKRQPLSVTAKPKLSAAQAAAQKPSKKTLETVAPIKAPRVKPSQRDKPVLETSKGSRKPVQIAAPSPKAATGKRQKLEAAAPKISARAAPLKPRKTTLETAAPLKPSRRKKPVLEIATVAPQPTRQRQPAPAPTIEPTPKPRRAARIAEALKPARAVPERLKSRNAPIGKAQTAPVSQARAKRLATPLEPIAQPRRAARGAAQPTPAPVKPRTPRVAQPPVAVAPVRPKSARSSPARPAPVAPSNPVQFGLFDALPVKTAPRRSAK